MLKRFLELFPGNTRSYGRYIPKNNSIFTVKKRVTEQEYLEHLNGSIGVSIVPIQDNNTCWWGAIDIDSHGADIPDINLLELDFRINDLDLPLIVCRSKSGGAHVYLFGLEPLNCALVRKSLIKFANQLGHPRAEIFPKQSKLSVDSKGNYQIGSPLNLPFFDWQSEKPLRYAVESGKEIRDLNHFLDLAYSKKITGADLNNCIDDSHDQSPPCISKIIAQGVAPGLRNIALYNLTTYLKKANPETWRDKAYDLNSKVFELPLPHSEATKVITSAGRKDYRYKCQEEPLKTLCNSNLCVTKKYGISREEASALTLGDMPNFTRLQKVDTDPVEWLLTVNETTLKLSTSDIMDFRCVRELVAEKMTVLIPVMKNDKWQAILNVLMLDAKTIEAPEEASIKGRLKAHFIEWCQKVDFSSNGEDLEKREDLFMRQPVVQTIKGKRCIVFKGLDFVHNLESKKVNEMKPHHMWSALRELGVSHKPSFKVKKRVVSVWYINIELVPEPADIKKIEIKTEY